MNPETLSGEAGRLLAETPLLDEEKARLTAIINWLKGELTKLHTERRCGRRSPATSHRTPEQQERVRQAVKMRLDGCSYVEIGNALGVTASRASTICFQGYMKIGQPW